MRYLAVRDLRKTLSGISWAGSVRVGAAITHVMVAGFGGLYKSNGFRITYSLFTEGKPIAYQKKASS